MCTLTSHTIELYTMSNSTNMEADDIVYDVIIVGAGLSGLTAAYRLKEMRPNSNIKILEASNRNGGRIYTADLPAASNKIDSWDMGGCWIGSSSVQPYINQLLADLEIEKFEQKNEGKKILQTSKKITYYDKSIPSMGLFSLFDAASVLKNLDGIQKKLTKWTTECLEYDSMTFESCLKSKAWTTGSVECARAAFRASAGLELSKVSSLFVLSLANSNGGFLNTFESGLKASLAYKISGGAQTIINKLVNKIGDDKIEYNTRVLSISTDQPRHMSFSNSLNIERSIEEELTFTLVIQTNGRSFKCHRVIMAISPHLIPSICFSPPLSPTKYEYFSSNNPGHLIKVVLTYETAFWREQGFSGEILTHGGQSKFDDCKTGPLCVVYDGETAQGSPALYCFIGGHQALEYGAKTKRERKEAVLNSLKDFFNEDQVRNFIVYCEKIWRDEFFVGGCPYCSVPPGVGQYFGPNIRSPENGIHFAGTEFGKVWIGFMEGAVESGERVIMEILSNSSQK